MATLPVDDRSGIHRRLRLGLVALALPSVTIGVWALLAPRSFYVDFPLPELAWVSRLPPFNEHLTTDVGGLYLAIAVLVVWAARTLSPELVRAVLVAHLVFALPHFLWHAFHLAGFSPLDALLQTLSLALFVLLPASLLVLARRMAAVAR